MGENAISLRNVSKAFGNKTVLDNLSLDVPKGKSTVVIGGSGTGKSVMLKCILGLLNVDGGEIFIDGVEIANAPRGVRENAILKTGMLFQGAALFDSMSVWENVAFGLMKVKKMKAKAARASALEKLALVELEADVADRNPADLSAGAQKRVGLARAIAMEPAILFFDEPTTGLDPIMADVIDELIVDVVKKVGATTLTITHDMESARMIGDQIAFLYEGKIKWHGSADGVLNSGNAYVEQFITGSIDGPISIDVRAG